MYSSRSLKQMGLYSKVFGGMVGIGYIFLCVFGNFFGMVAAYDYSCDGGVFFGGFLVQWVDYSGTHPIRGFC